MDLYRLNANLYQYPFRQPLQTSHGIWLVREGMIVSLTDDLGNVGYGEIAPIPWFGSETVTEAWQFCHRLGNRITQADIGNIPDGLFACQFGFESALEDLEDRSKHLADDSIDERIEYSFLLPAGEKVLDTWQDYWHRGGRTFKWKIGVLSCTEETAILLKLVNILPEQVKLRLDANGGLSLDCAKRWLEIAERFSTIEFIEQPLPPQQFDRMLELSGNYRTAIALDESIANLVRLQECYHRGWRGIFTIKAGIFGSPSRLRQFCQQHPIDTVFSSVFETPIGRKAALKLASQLSNLDRAVGFGVDRYFPG